MFPASIIRRLVVPHLLLITSAQVGILASLSFVFKEMSIAIGAGLVTGFLFYASMRVGNEGYVRLVWAFDEIKTGNLDRESVIQVAYGTLQLLMYSVAALIIISTLQFFAGFFFPLIGLNLSSF